MPIRHLGASPWKQLYPQSAHGPLGVGKDSRQHRLHLHLGEEIGDLGRQHLLQQGPVEDDALAHLFFLDLDQPSHHQPQLAVVGGQPQRDHRAELDIDLLGSDRKRTDDEPLASIPDGIIQGHIPGLGHLPGVYFPLDPSLLVLPIEVFGPLVGIHAILRYRGLVRRGLVVVVIPEIARWDQGGIVDVWLGGTSPGAGQQHPRRKGFLELVEQLMAFVGGVLEGDLRARIHQSPPQGAGGNLRRLPAIGRFVNLEMQEQPVGHIGVEQRRRSQNGAVLPGLSIGPKHDGGGVNGTVVVVGPAIFSGQHGGDPTIEAPQGQVQPCGKLVLGAGFELFAFEAQGRGRDPAQSARHQPGD